MGDFKGTAGSAGMGSDFNAWFNASELCLIKASLLVAVRKELVSISGRESPSITNNNFREPIT